jgi:Glycosyltransferase family 87
VGITLAAVLVLTTARSVRRTVLGGVLLGLAIATKMTPVLAAPALLRRRWLTVTVSAAGAFTAVYVPHVLAVGSKVIGFLPGYLQQEDYTNGARYGLIGLLVTGWLASLLAVLVLAAVAVAVLEFGDPDRPWQGGVVMTAAALAVTTPHYQWYALLLVMLVALDGRIEFLAFAAGGYYSAEPSLGRYTPPWRLVDAIAYGVPLLVVLVVTLVRHRVALRDLIRRELPVLAGRPAPEPAVGRAPRSAEPAVGLAAEPASGAATEATVEAATLAATDEVPV